MANTFKLKTKAGVTTLATVYTVPSSTTAIVLGCVIGNTTSNSVNTTVTVSSDTSDTETNADVEILTVDGLTEGAACTALIAKNLINNDRPLLICNSDQWVD